MGFIKEKKKLIAGKTLLALATRLFSSFTTNTQ